MIGRLAGIAQRNGAQLLRNSLGRCLSSASRVESLFSLHGSVVNELPRGIPSIEPIPSARFLSTTRHQQQQQQQEIQQEQKNLDDFQHEEITGPTVERDLSATANELRGSIEAMLQSNAKLKRALVTAGVAQIIAGYWLVSGGGLSKTLCLVLVLASSGMSLSLAYHFHATMKHVSFFQRVEERSRMRVLTLAMQAIKAATLALRRGDVIARATALLLLGGCVYEAIPKNDEVDDE